MPDLLQCAYNLCYNLAIFSIIKWETISNNVYILSLDWANRVNVCYSCYARRIFPGLKNSLQLPNTRPGSLDPTYVMHGYNRLRSAANAMSLCMSFVYLVRRSLNALLVVAKSYSPK